MTFFPLKVPNQSVTHICYVTERATCPLDLNVLGLFTLTILGGVCNLGIFLREFHRTCGIKSCVRCRTVTIAQRIFYVYDFF